MADDEQQPTRLLFVVNVRGNKPPHMTIDSSNNNNAASGNHAGTVKVLIDAPLTSHSLQTLNQRIWLKLYGYSAPESVDWAYTDGSPINLLAASDVDILYTSVGQHMQSCETHLTVRVKDSEDTWTAQPAQQPTSLLDAAVNNMLLSGASHAKQHSQSHSHSHNNNSQPATRQSSAALGAAATEDLTSGISTRPLLNGGGGDTDMTRTQSYNEALGNDREALVSNAAAKVRAASTTEIPNPPPYPRGSRTPSYASSTSVMSDTLWWLPANHPLSRAFELTTMLVIALSVISFVVESIPKYRLNDDGTDKADGTSGPFFAIETFCIAWFTLEFAMRFYASSDKLNFWRRPLNIIDIIAILPYYIGLAVGGSGASSLAIIRILRLSRVLRMFKLSRHNEGLRALLECMAASVKELVLYIIIVFVVVILFGSAMFYIEKDVDDTLFISIPVSMWWAVITLTTVGYGDIFPTTDIGRAVGGLCACLGVILLAIPASIFIGEFMRIHQESKRSKAGFLPPVEKAISHMELSLDSVSEYTNDIALAFKELERLRRQKKDGAAILLEEDKTIRDHVHHTRVSFHFRGATLSA